MYSYPFDPNSLANLTTLVEKTQASLVISSDWRKDKEGIETLLKELKKYDLDKRVIGCTPILNGNRREEIKQFLRNFKYDNTVNFVILDDDTKYMGDLLPYLVNTDNQVGLTKENVEQAIHRLTRSRKKENDEFER